MKKTAIDLRRVTTILVVDAIEPALPSWKGPLGYEQIAAVEHETKLGFVLLARDGQQVMLQTKASLAADLPAVAALEPGAVLYVDVASLDAALAAMGKEGRVIVPPRTTFYGAREAWLVDAAGTIIGFAEPAPKT